MVKKRLIPAVVYYRMSTDKQDASITQQRIAVEKYAKEHGYRIVREYIDEGISGDATEKRFEFQRMIRDAAGGTFQAIIVWDQDRFGRFDSIEAGHWIHPLRQAGVQLVTIVDGLVDWSDFSGRVIYTIKQEGKHQFLRDLSRNVLRGKLAAAKRGEWISRAPYGYRVKNKVLHLGPALEVETVRRIFRDYLDGLSIRGVCLALNAEGVKSQTGGMWSPKTVRAVLTRQTYIGRYVWNGQHSGKYHAVSGDEVTSEFVTGGADESDWIVFDNHHLPIIDIKTFEAVQRRLAERQTITTPRAGGSGFLFTGIIRCAKCGGRMHGINRSGIRYRCTREAHAGACQGNAVNQDQLLAIALQTIQEQFLDDGNIGRLRREIHRQIKTGTAPVDIAAMRSELSVIDSKLAKAKRRLVEVDADMLDVVQEQLRDLRQQDERLQASLKAAERPQGRRIADETIDRAVAMLQRLQDVFKKADVALQREVIRRTFARIDVLAERDPYHGQRPYRLKRGVIHLHSEIAQDLLLSS
jgi:site-specific DNA recombinase